MRVQAATSSSGCVDKKGGQALVLDQLVTSGAPLGSSL